MRKIPTQGPRLYTEPITDVVDRIIMVLSRTNASSICLRYISSMFTASQLHTVLEKCRRARCLSPQSQYILFLARDTIMLILVYRSNERGICGRRGILFNQPRLLSANLPKDSGATARSSSWSPLMEPLVVNGRRSSRVLLHSSMLIGNDRLSAHSYRLRVRV